MCDEMKNVSTRLVDIPFASAIYSEANPYRLSLPAGNIVAITIGPDSDIDMCMVRGDNGKEPLDLNNPVWGPFGDGAVEIWHRYQQVISNTDASATRTIVGDASAGPVKLQLKVWYDCPVVVVPSQTKRAFKRFKKVDITPGAGTATWEFACHGRERVAIALAETAGTNATVVIKGRIQRDQALVSEDTIIASFTLTASTEQIYYIHEDLLEYVHFSITGNGSKTTIVAEVHDR